MSMYIKIKKMVVILLSLSPLMAEVNLDRGVYKEADDMVRFDNKLNRLIAEHNNIDLDEENTPINDFEETKKGYRLTETIDNNSSKIDVKLKDRVLTIVITKTEKNLLDIDGEKSYEITKSESSSSLFLPEDADENSMKKEYQDGILTVEFLKK